MWNAGMACRCMEHRKWSAIYKRIDCYLDDVLPHRFKLLFACCKAFLWQTNKPAKKKFVEQKYAKTSPFRMQSHEDEFRSEASRWKQLSRNEMGNQRKQEEKSHTLTHTVQMTNIVNTEGRQAPLPAAATSENNYDAMEAGRKTMQRIIESFRTNAGED